MKPCTWHIKDTLGYIDGHADAEERMKRGEKQIKCRQCKLWFWPDHFGNPTTAKEGEE